MLKKIVSHLRSKWYRYLLEIIVVILGILIAYNLEQWSESRSNQKNEIDILKEFRRALTADLTEMRGNIEMHQYSIRSSEIILKVIAQNLPYHDSLDVCFAYTHTFSVFSGRVGPIEQLKNTNLSIVTNDSLRLAIISMYDEMYPRIRRIELAVIRDYEELRDFDRLYFEAYDFDAPSTHPALPTTLWGVMKPLRFDELKKQPEYAALLRARISNQIGLLRIHYQPAEKELSKLLDQIDNEIAELE